MPAQKNFFDAFRCNDRASCLRAIRNGAVAAFVAAAFSGVIALLGFVVPTDDPELSALFDPWMLVDVVCTIVLALFILKKSRIAATLMLIYFVAGKIALWIEIGKPQGLPLAVLFAAFLAAAARTTFLWHSRYKREGEFPTVS